MKEKELRLALVFYGGVSLAIYQHGVNREILNLLRASRAYHAPRTPTLKQAPSHTYDAQAHWPSSTEPVYFDLLKALGKSLDLRVIVDIISGSSAGGINGITLGRAIAHDLDIAPITKLWLDEADILSLLAPKARPKPWSKWYVWPFVRLLFLGMKREGLLPAESGVEMRHRITSFIRSRWFKPPLDGEHFLDLLFNGFEAMNADAARQSTLLPPESLLDVYLSVTEYYGFERPIFIHDPPVIHERDYRRLLHFMARSSGEQSPVSGFDDDNIAGLAFASRATASYPGAFPPASIAELDDFLKKTSRTWGGRSRFYDANFAAELAASLHPEDIILLDGSILNNRPVQAAIRAISQHYAYREVDRRLVYVDPHPVHPDQAKTGQIPGFFSTIRNALSDLPRTIPIFEELESVGILNSQVDRLQEIVELSRDHVISLIEQATVGAIGDELSEGEIRHLRLTSTNALAAMALVYDPWVRALVNEGIDVITSIINDICGYNRFSEKSVRTRRVIEAWCKAHAILADNYRIPDEVMEDKGLPVFSRFIVDFGIPYKKRRISLVISSVNSLYRKLDQPAFASASSADLDQLKRKLTRSLEDLDRGASAYRSDRKLRLQACNLFCSASFDDWGGPENFAHFHDADLTSLLNAISQTFSLVGTNVEVDKILTSPEVNRMSARCRQEIRSGFVGFPYWDIVLLPVMGAIYQTMPNAYSFSKILIDRISPVDGTSFAEIMKLRALQGASVIGFGGFMSRQARENDYLWGRLNGVERLVDIIKSAVADPELKATIDFEAFKKQAFTIVLDQESDALGTASETIAAIRRALAP
ncbi:MAG: patatin-like protein [Novosphingobium sp.]|nr:patatin-like protein [Novosphingobium sp.]